MRYTGIGFIVVLLAASGIVQGATARATDPGEVLVPFLDTSRADWQSLEAAGDITFDPETGNYRIYYTSFDGARKFWVFEPSSKVKVGVEAQVMRHATGAYVYRYTAHNLDSSSQYLDWFMVRYDGAEIYDVVVPGELELWWFSPSVSMTDTPEEVAAWTGRLKADATDADIPGIPPGECGVFGFTSRQPPGVVTCYAVGYVPDSIVGPVGADAEMVRAPLPNLLQDSAVGTTIGPVPGALTAQPEFTWVALRSILPAPEWALAWDNESKTAIATSGDSQVHVQLENLVAFVNGKPVVLPAAPRIVEGQIEVPNSLVAQVPS